jgi:uncharacterized protein
VETEDQREIVSFLSRSDTYGPASLTVDVIETHSAVVFLAGDRAFKLKRAVCYDYLDFSTGERRRRFVEAELALNRRVAPALYRRVAAVTRDAQGTLHLDGPGRPIEWLLEMTRFDGDALCDRLAERGALPLAAMPALARMVATLHAGAEPRPSHGGAGGMRWVIEGNASAFAEFGDAVLPTVAAHRVTARATAALDALAPCLNARRAAGRVRQCHGDLHLRNVVMLDGTPTPFDAVEFNDEIACIDVFYDLAFLLMDLWRRGLDRHANVVLNEYVRVTGDVDGLRLLPLFLSCRAAIRAKTNATSAALSSDAGAASAQIATARDYLARAAAFLDPAAPALVAIGGPSGTGKSTLAAHVAPRLGPPPGALHLRSDVVRKMLLGRDPLDRLGPEAYSADVSARVYESMRDLARAAIDAGHAVVCDAVFGETAEHAALARVAQDLSTAFVPIWLDAPVDVLAARVAERRGDASDATPDVVRGQVGRIRPPGEWHRVDATGNLDATVAAIVRLLDARGIFHR